VYLINETAMKLLGWQSPEDALGQEISWSISNITLDFGPISGVVKDYHQETLKNTIDPTIMVYEPIWLRTFMIKLKTERIQETIAGIKGVWDELFPQYPMEYYFLDDLYEDLNKNERVKLELLYLLSGQAIIISFIGLFGLISFSLKTRIREIAIRKVLGADAGRLIKLIGQEYLLILVLASIVAVPLSYFFIDRWLQQFAYKADISFANYGITVILMGLLILFTVSFQTIKTSSINPADTLREE
jgi:putative ABC transport system permease protein